MTKDKFEEKYCKHCINFRKCDFEIKKTLGIYKQDFWDCKNYINLFECCTKKL